MSRRPKPAEQQFGSDSFLDVLANMVGILIILIVIAGLRVAQNPAPKLSQQPVEPAPALPLPPEDDSSSTPMEPDFVPPLAFEAEEPEPSPVEIALPEDPPEPEPDPGPISPPARLVAEARDLEQQKEQLRGQTAQTAEELEALRRRLAALQSEGQSATTALKTRESELAQRESELQQFQANVDRQREHVTALLAEFETVKKSRVPSLEVRHRITPVSRVVRGTEVHFRLSEGKVSQVPIAALEERLKSQLLRQKDWLAKFRTHQGTVGPVNGYSMNYLVERTSLTTVEQMRHGQGTFRLQVAMWKIVPESDLEVETVEQALRSGSRFHMAVNEIEPGSTLTFWVYPDSYAQYRALQRACHKQGFEVSGRPLPEGVPIAGSPHGSRSAGQ
jgi:hypothetical protein